MHRREFLLFIGRICPEKGVSRALRVAHRLGMSMVVAGPVHPFRFHQDYFTNEVAPLLDNQRRYVGAVDIAEKCDLLRRARCLLIPSVAAETSSLVAMEAAASGVPVVAYKSGALAEIVEDGITGFVVPDEDRMAEAVTRISEISPAICRAHAVERFDENRMANDYLAIYSELVNERLKCQPLVRC
jgi:glycosyltransferase involved in cell wall biosynthesis